MLIFKSGNVLRTGNLLMSNLTPSGTYASLFPGPNQNAGPRDISYITAYVRRDAVAPIPLPAAEWLLMSGVADLGRFGRCKRAAA